MQIHFEIAGVEEAREYISRHLVGWSPDRSILEALSDTLDRCITIGKIVVMGCVCGLFHAGDDGELVELHLVFVSPRLRRYGLCRALVGYLSDGWRRRVVLTPVDGDAAVAFERIGFEFSWYEGIEIAPPMFFVPRSGVLP
jgi:hypothetical protein